MVTSGSPGLGAGVGVWAGPQAAKGRHCAPARPATVQILRLAALARDDASPPPRRPAARCPAAPLPRNAHYPNVTVHRPLAVSSPSDLPRPIASGLPITARTFAIPC